MTLGRLAYPWTIVTGLVGALLLPVAVVGGSVLAARAATGLSSDAVLRAEGVTVTREDLKQQVRVLGALYGLRAPADPARVEEFNRYLARDVALRLVLDREIAERHLTVTDARAHQLLADFIAHSVNPPGPEGFVALLRDVGASEADVVAELSRQEATRALFRQVTAPAAAPVGEPAVRAYFEAHQAELAHPEQRHLRNIVVSAPEQAAVLLADLGHGADFAAVAKQSSLDRKSRTTGGELGTLSAEDLEEPYRAAAFAAAPGAVFGPVRTSAGWNIGQVLEVRPAAQVTFEQVRDQLGGWLRARNVERAWQAFLQQRLAAAHVRYAPAYQPADPTAVAVMLGSADDVLGK